MVIFLHKFGKKIVIEYNWESDIEIQVEQFKPSSRLVEEICHYLIKLPKYYKLEFIIQKMIQVQFCVRNDQNI